MPFADRVAAARLVGEASSGYGPQEASALVDVYSWNPRTTRARWIAADALKAAGLARRVDNFGDLLGPVVVTEILDRLGYIDFTAAAGPSRLLSVGSLLHAARDGDCIWGSGIWGYRRTVWANPASLDIRAVRGPLTGKYLHGLGARVPSVFGDPALLVGQLWDAGELRRDAPLRDLVVVPHFRELGLLRRGQPAVVSPRAPLADVLSHIASSAFVVGSSLHAIVVAESLGIGARLVRSSAEPEAKYLDYYLGTGRSGYSAATSVRGAEALGPEPPPSWSATPLLNAFPIDLWREPTTEEPRRPGAANTDHQHSVPAGGRRRL